MISMAYDRRRETACFVRRKMAFVFAASSPLMIQNEIATRTPAASGLVRRKFGSRRVVKDEAVGRLGNGAASR
jgi:hypothetical protein